MTPVIEDNPKLSSTTFTQCCVIAKTKHFNATIYLERSKDTGEILGYYWSKPTIRVETNAGAYFTKGQFNLLEIDATNEVKMFLKNETQRLIFDASDLVEIGQIVDEAIKKRNQYHRIQ